MQNEPQTDVLIVVGVAFALAFIIGHYIKRRRFKRTNVAGVQEYKSYANKMMSDAWEGCLGGIATIFSLVFILGLIWALIAYLGQTPP